MSIEFNEHGFPVDVPIDSTITTLRQLKYPLADHLAMEIDSATEDKKQGVANLGADFLRYLRENSDGDVKKTLDKYFEGE